MMKPQLPHLYLVALGTNMGDRAAHLSRARIEIEHRLGPILAMSKVYETEPMGVADALFLNAALVVQTSLDPEAALTALLAAETSMGRVRQERWGNRVIDLDLLLWRPHSGTSTPFSSPTLTIPHPHMLTRDFVMRPAREVAPDWLHPLTGLRLN